MPLKKSAARVQADAACRLVFAAEGGRAPEGKPARRARPMKATRLAGRLWCKRRGRSSGEDFRRLLARGPLSCDRLGYTESHSLWTSFMLLHGLSVSLRACPNSSSKLSILPFMTISGCQRRVTLYYDIGYVVALLRTTADDLRWTNLQIL